MHKLCLITCKVRSENGYGFLRPGLKTGVGNGIFWSEIGSGFGDVGSTPPPKIPRSVPRACLSSSPLGCGRKRQHHLLSLLHLGNFVHICRCGAMLIHAPVHGLLLQILKGAYNSCTIYFFFMNNTIFF